MPSRTKVQTNLFDPPNEKRLGGFPNPDPQPQFLLQMRTKYFRNQSYPAFLPSFLLVRVSIVRGFGGGPREVGVVTIRTEILGLFILSLRRRRHSTHHNICTWGGRPHNECMRAVDAMGTFAFLGGREERKGRPRPKGRVMDRSLGPLMK